MGNIVDVDLKVDPQYLKKSAEEIVKAGIIQALGNPSDILKSAIDSVFAMQVDSEGKPTSNTYRSKPYLNWLAEKTVEDTVREVMRETIEERKEEFMAAIKKQIQQKKFYDKVAGEFIKSMINAAETSWSMPIDVTFRKHVD